MNKLHIFGDSYSTPGYFVDPQDSWWGLLAKDLGHKIHQVNNYSWPGSNLDTISHIMTARNDMFAPNDFIVVSIPPVPRLTMYNPDKKLYPKIIKMDNTNLIEIDREDILCHSGLAQYSVQDMGKEYVSVYDPGWAQAQALRSILLLNTFIRTITKCSNLIFLNVGEPYQYPTEWPTLKFLQLQVDKDIMLIFDNTYYSINLNLHKPSDFDTYGWFGHHDAKGNKHWYDNAIKPMITRLGWT